MTEGPLAVFVADATLALGGGHVMRCLTLAEQMRAAGWHTGFATGPQAATIVPRLLTLPDHLAVDAGLPDARRLREQWPAGCDVLVVDNYTLDAAFEARCRPWARRVLAIDDLADRPHDCDFLLDQTFGREDAAYRPLVPAPCRLMLGTPYALLRPHFGALRRTGAATRDRSAPVRRILVSMGLSDPSDATGLVLDGIAESGLDVTVDLVMGASARHLARTRERVRAMAGRATLHVEPGDLAMLMAQADLAVGAAGTTSWERCCLGLPSIVVAVAANQHEIARRLDDVGAVLSLGPEGSVERHAVGDALRRLAQDPELRCRMSARAAEVCDGEGAQRVCAALIRG